MIGGLNMQLDEAETTQEMYNIAGYIIKKFSTLGIEKSLGRRHLKITDIVEKSDTAGEFAHCENINNNVVCIIEESLLEKFPLNTQGKMKILILFMKYTLLVSKIEKGDETRAKKLIDEIKQLLDSTTTVHSGGSE